MAIFRRLGPIHEKPHSAANEFLHASTAAHIDPPRAVAAYEAFLRSLDKGTGLFRHGRNDGVLTHDEYIGSMKKLYERRLHAGADPKLTEEAEVDMRASAESFVNSHKGHRIVIAEEVARYEKHLGGSDTKELKKLERQFETQIENGRRVNPDAAVAALTNLLNYVDARKGNNDKRISRKEMGVIAKLSTSRQEREDIEAITNMIPEKGMSIKDFAKKFGQGVVMMANEGNDEIPPHHLPKPAAGKVKSQ